METNKANIFTMYEAEFGVWKGIVIIDNIKRVIAIPKTVLPA